MTHPIEILDLQFQTHGTVASFLIETEEGPVLVETGPHATFAALEQGLASRGHPVSAVRHVLLSHIHFDHAGAAWAMARAGARVHVHPVGLPHLESPQRLYDSARRIYGDQMESLWGVMEPIPADQLVPIADGQRLEIGGAVFTAHHTPGHAKHHIAWQLEDALFTGDVAGAKMGQGPVSPPCPPPDIDIEQWLASIARIEQLGLSRLYLTHFGPVTDICGHMAELRERLHGWAEWIRARMAQGQSAEEMTPGFQEFAAAELRAAGLDEHGVAQYEAANPAWMSVAGLMRYWRKRSDQ